MDGYEKYFEYCSDCRLGIRLEKCIWVNDNTVYCVSCAFQHHKKEFDILSQKNKSLEEKVSKLEKFVQDMWDYSPYGKGYEEAKEHFESLTDDKSKVE